MVRLDERLQRIKEDYIDEECYFVINRGRQYGKTTTLKLLKEYLREDYIVLSLDFQEVETANFANGIIFSQSLAKKTVQGIRLYRNSGQRKNARSAAEL